jgi:hypothetical protein
MKAFISYSLNDTDQYILTILSRKLNEEGFSIWSSHSGNSTVLDFKTFSRLNKSNLFIHTENNQANNRVLEEWKEEKK